MPSDLTQGGQVFGPFISRPQAKACGAKQYFTGKTCKNDHTDLRYTSTGQCSTCLRKWKKTYSADPVKHERRKACNRASSARRVAANPDCVARRRAAGKKARQSFKTKRGLSRTAWYYQNDEQFRLAHNCRARVRRMIIEHGGMKTDSFEKLVGCSLEQLVSHIEQQFQTGMTWSNYSHSTWHVDHIRPCASFDLTDPAQQRECFHFSNLQPLWAADNMRKNDKWEPVAA